MSDYEYDEDEQHVSDQEYDAFAECPYCSHPFNIEELFPEPGLGGIEKHICTNCYNVFEVAEEIHLVYEVIESAPRNSRMH